MATTGSAKRPSSPARHGSRSERTRTGSRVRAGHLPYSDPPEEGESKRCAACVKAPGGGPACGFPACPLCLARSRTSGGQRVRRRSDPEKSCSRAGRRDCDCRREFFVSPAVIQKPTDGFSGLSSKHKSLLFDDRDEARKRNALSKDELGSLRDEKLSFFSDSENEEPISQRIRNISAFIRKTKNFSSVTVGGQRSRSCTDSVEDQGGKLKLIVPPAATMDPVGICHSFAAGILLSSENSRSVSAPISAPDRRHPWRAVLTSWAPPGPPPSRPERSISPESNDSISEELNHFKPIVCSPCTPPKRLPDGRLQEPVIVKSTPRNLTRGLHRATSYEASPAVLNKWRQIELDRQSLNVSSRSTLTSPIAEGHVQVSTDGATEATKNCQVPAFERRSNKRRLLFEPPAGDGFQSQTVKIRVPAVRYTSKMASRTPESCTMGTLFSQRQSVSPYSQNSCKLVPIDTQSPRKDSDRSFHNQSTSRRAEKRKQKTKHLDLGQNLDLDSNQNCKMKRPVSREDLEEQLVQLQERRDRALALKLQRQFDRENQSATRRTSPDSYRLRSWTSNQNCRRCGLRRSRRISKKH